MTGSLGSLAIATAAFVVSHFVLSALPVRGPMIARLGEWPFRILYSTVSLLLFVWMLAAFAAVDRHEIWHPPALTRLIALLLMLAAFFMVVSGMTTRNPTAVGQEKAIAMRPVGIIAVTRHPSMWGFLLWAVAHLLANGDARGMIVFAGMGILAGIGMMHIDWRKKATQGEAWNDFAARTSLVPFAAIVAERTRLDLREIGWGRAALAAVLYMAFLYAHRPIFGVAPLPWFSA